MLVAGCYYLLLVDSRDFRGSTVVHQVTVGNWTGLARGVALHRGELVAVLIASNQLLLGK